MVLSRCRLGRGSLVCSEVRWLRVRKVFRLPLPRVSKPLLMASACIKVTSPTTSVGSHCTWWVGPTSSEPWRFRGTFYTQQCVQLMATHKCQMWHLSADQNSWLPTTSMSQDSCSWSSQESQVGLHKENLRYQLYEVCKGLISHSISQTGRP